MEQHKRIDAGVGRHPRFLLTSLVELCGPKLTTE
jgi:hypothetical protein